MNQDATTGHGSKRTDTLILLLILALASFLRFYRLDDQSLWYDEAYTASVTDPAMGGLPYIWSSGPIAYMPPLHHTLVYLSRLLGTGEAFIRLPSVVVGILTVLVVYLLGCYCFNKRVGALSALVISVSTFHVYYSQEARSYALLMLCATASTYFLFRAIREHCRPWWAAYAVLVAMGLYTHLYMAFVILVQNTYLLSQWRVGRVSIRAWLVSQAVSFIPFLPWLVVNADFYWLLYRGASSANGSWGRDLWMPPATPGLPVTILRDFFSGRPFSPDFTTTLSPVSIGPDWFAPVASLLASEAFALAICLPILFVGFRRLRGQQEAGNYAEFIGLTILMPLILMFVISFRTRLLASRYISFALPSLFILLGLGLDLIRSQKVRALLLAGIIAANGVGLVNYYFNTDHQRDPWRDAARVIQESEKPGDVVFASSGIILVATDYYYKGRAPVFGIGGQFLDSRDEAWRLMKGAMVGGTRAWLIAWMDGGLSATYRDALREHCQGTWSRDFKSIALYFYQTCAP